VGAAACSESDVPVQPVYHDGALDGFDVIVMLGDPARFVFTARVPIDGHDAAGQSVPCLVPGVADLPVCNELPVVKHSNLSHARGAGGRRPA
jgi:hypothetical protein